MASRSFNQFLFSLNPALTYIQGTVAIGATGAVGTTTGSGIDSVVRLAAGVYKIILQDNYFRYLGQECSMNSSVTGSTAATALTPGVVYVIATMGTTTQAQWETAGVPAGTTAAVGVTFLAAATSAGTGTASTTSPSGISEIEVLGNPNTTIKATANPYIVIQTLGATATADTAQIPKDPTNGSTLNIGIMLRNSSLLGKGE